MVALVVCAHVVAAEDANKSAAIATLSVWNERTREKVAILPVIWNLLKAVQ
jgi:hypothetical protein